MSKKHSPPTAFDLVHEVKIITVKLARLRAGIEVMDIASYGVAITLCHWLLDHDFDEALTDEVLAVEDEAETLDGRRAA